MQTKAEKKENDEQFGHVTGMNKWWWWWWWWWW